MLRSAARVSSSNALFNDWLERSAADIAMLSSRTPQGLYPYAGVPWFSTVFGRDGIVTAMQTLWVAPQIARGVLGYLAAHQADRVDPMHDAEPGKILHEVRQGEMAATGEVPFARYYGSHDATPLFVMLAAQHWRQTNDHAMARRLWPHVERALDWMDRYGDPDGDGFLEYARSNERGLIQQGWKDSHDSIFHADGRMAAGPIATCELQAYAYAARVGAAELAALLGHDERGARAGPARGRPAARFDAAFWDEELGTYALALDGEKQRCRVRASNAGHVLWSGIALPERAGRVAETLLSDASFSGWGIRTVAAARRATTRSRTTTARSGRTTTPSRPWAWRATAATTRRRAPAGRPVRRQPHLRSCPAAGAVLRLHPPAWRGRHALSGRLLAAGLGRGIGLHAAAGGPGPGGRRAGAAGAFPALAAARLPGRPVSHRSARRRCEPSTSASAASRWAWTCGSCAGAATSR